MLWFFKPCFPVVWIALIVAGLLFAVWAPAPRQPLKQLRNY